MATGKTHARWYRLIMDAVNLSGDSRQIGSFGVEYDTADVTGWSDGVVNHLLGQPSHIFTGYQAVLNNTAVTGSHTELSAVEEYILSLFIGIRAAPAVGDMVFMTTVEQSAYTVDGSPSPMVSINAVKSITDADHVKAFGVALAVGDELTATTNGTSVDNGVASALGALAHLHITASDGGTWAFKVQDSPDDGAWADLITFSSDGTAIAAESGDVAAAATTPDRYVRFQATRTSGTCTAWCCLVRD